MEVYFALLLITLNVPLRIGKCIPGGTCTQVGNPWSRERDFCKRDRNDTSSCSESASQVFSSENDIGNFVGVHLTDSDRRKVLFDCWSPPSGFSFPNVTVGAQNRSLQKQWLNEFTWLAYSNTTELFAHGALCLLLRLSVVAQNLPAH